MVLCGYFFATDTLIYEGQIFFSPDRHNRVIEYHIYMQLCYYGSIWLFFCHWYTDLWGSNFFFHQI